MIQVLKQAEKNILPPKELKNDDIFITQVNEVEEIDKDGNRVIKTEKKRINLTRKINETAKLLKAETLQEKYNKLKEIIEKEN